LFRTSQTSGYPPAITLTQVKIEKSSKKSFLDDFSNS
jgi:hypothetical protein